MQLLRLICTNAILATMLKPNLDGVKAGNVEEPAMRSVLDAPAVVPVALNDMDIFDDADRKTLLKQPNAEANDHPLGGHDHIQGNSRAQTTRISAINPGITAGEPDITSNNVVPPATTRNEASYSSIRPLL